MSKLQTVAKFWNARPCNIRHSNKEIGTKEYFDEVEARKFFVEPHILSFTNFPTWKNKKVLEVGCGIGTAAINFARNGADYYGMELSEKSLELTQKRFEVYGQKGNLFLGNAEKLSEIIPVQKFDLIYSFGVIHHSPNPRNIIKEITKYMDSTSVLKIMLYSKDSWKSYLIEAGLEQPEAQTGCPIALTYNEADIKKLLKEFEIQEIKKDHVFQYNIPEYKKYNYVKEPWFKEMPEEMLRVFETKLGWHTLITAKLK